MATTTNHAAWLEKADTPLKVDVAEMPTPGPGEIVVKNAAVVSETSWMQAPCLEVTGFRTQDAFQHSLAYS